MNSFRQKFKKKKTTQNVTKSVKINILNISKEGGLTPCGVKFGSVFLLL